MPLAQLKVHVHDDSLGLFFAVGVGEDHERGQSPVVENAFGRLLRVLRHTLGVQALRDFHPGFCKRPFHKEAALLAFRSSLVRRSSTFSSRLVMNKSICIVFRWFSTRAVRG